MANFNNFQINGQDYQLQGVDLSEYSDAPVSSKSINEKIYTKLGTNNYTIFDGTDELSFKMNLLFKELYIHKKDEYITSNYVVLELYRQNTDLYGDNYEENTMQISFYERTSDGERSGMIYKYVFDLSDYKNGYIYNTDATIYKNDISQYYDIRFIIEPSTIYNKDFINKNWTHIKINDLAYNIYNSPNLCCSTNQSIQQKNNSVLFNNYNPIKYTLQYTGENNHKTMSNDLVIKDNDNWSMYDFLDISNNVGNYIYILQGNFINGAHIFGFCDENKKLIKKVNLGEPKNKLYTQIPENAHYFLAYHYRYDHDRLYTYSIYIIDQSNISLIAQDSLYEYKFPEIDNHYLPRPSNGVVNFNVPVNVNIANTTDRTLNNQDTTQIYYDWGVLILPTTYSISGPPTRLVIACHGTGTWINNSTKSTTHSSILTSQGYAVMDMNGIPYDFVESSNYEDTGDRHYGAPFALDSYINGYRYVIKNYNICDDGCFIYGISMGGLTSFMITLSNAIPIIAQGGFCPCIDLYKQAFVNPWNGEAQRKSIASYFGFSGTEPTWSSSKPPTQDEINYFMNNSDKWIGYNSMTKNVYNLDYETLYNYIPSISEIEDESEQEIYDKYSRFHPVPLKIWHNYDDSTVRWRYSKYFVEMVNRSGGLAYLRTFPEGGHNAWSTGDDVQIETISGSTMTIKTSIYELIQWFKRFDRI